MADGTLLVGSGADQLPTNGMLPGDEGRAFVGPVGQTLYTMATLPPVTQMVPGDRVAWISVQRTDGRVTQCYGNGTGWIDMLTGAAVA